MESLLEYLYIINYTQILLKKEKNIKATIDV